MLFPTSLVGSYPQPEWLIDRGKLSKQVPRVRADDLWLVSADKLEAAQDDATILAIREQERAGLDIITDGEQRRESYSNRFATALDGIDIDNPGTVINRNGKPIPVPRIAGPIRRRQPVELRDLKVLRANTDRKIKATVPGPFTMGRQAQDDYYGDEEAVAMAYAEAVNAEIKDLFAAPGPISFRSTSRGCSSIPTRRGTMASRRLTAHSRALAERSRCICASAMPPWCGTSRRAIPSCRNWNSPRRSRFRSRRRSRSSI